METVVHERAWSQRDWLLTATMCVLLELGIDERRDQGDGIPFIHLEPPTASVILLRPTYAPEDQPLSVSE